MNIMTDQERFDDYLGKAKADLLETKVLVDQTIEQANAGNLLEAVESINLARVSRDDAAYNLQSARHLERKQKARNQ